MPVGGEYQLLAGLRRLQAAQLLGWTEIDVNVVSPKDAEAALRIEYSENEQREPFTYSEKMDYARLIEAIVKAKAKERQKESGATFGRGQAKKVQLAGAEPIPAKRQSRDIVGEKIGMSGQTYQRASYVAEHAPPEVIEQLDSGDKTINAAYREIRAAEKTPPPPAPAPVSKPAPVEAPAPAPKAPAPKPKKAPPSEPVREPMPPPETPLERAIRAERELDAMKYRQHNEIYHRDSIIENLEMQHERLVACKEALENRVAELETALEAAQARIRELEEAGHA